ncbi:hypothetical protein P280DRAFT_510341 [Massarina eburnea CBS 473.64]|uniref:Uncharacterized protein n=1 Tax=Massarina eburnea CBS 473.64 TaxID=1395130 RepID=A0A6A6RMV8_9PLEO|nr:hypothetical protein P280DRAFT_510341 [Massarina eburnea CBS 473.64]
MKAPGSACKGVCAGGAGGAGGVSEACARRRWHRTTGHKDAPAAPRRTASRGRMRGTAAAGDSCGRLDVYSPASADGCGGRAVIHRYSTIAVRARVTSRGVLTVSEHASDASSNTSSSSSSSSSSGSSSTPGRARANGCRRRPAHAARSSASCGGNSRRTCCTEHSALMPPTDAADRCPRQMPPTTTDRLEPLNQPVRARGDVMCCVAGTAPASQQHSPLRAASAPRHWPPKQRPSDKGGAARCPGSFQTSAIVIALTPLLSSPRPRRARGQPEQTRPYSNNNVVPIVPIAQLQCGAPFAQRVLGAASPTPKEKRAPTPQWQFIHNAAHISPPAATQLRTVMNGWVLVAHTRAALHPSIHTPAPAGLWLFPGYPAHLFSLEGLCFPARIKPIRFDHADSTSVRDMCMYRMYARALSTAGPLCWHPLPANERAASHSPRPANGVDGSRLQTESFKSLCRTVDQGTHSLSRLSLKRHASQGMPARHSTRCGPCIASMPDERSLAVALCILRRARSFKVAAHQPCLTCPISSLALKKTPSNYFRDGPLEGPMGVWSRFNRMSDSACALRAPDRTLQNR